MKVATKFITAIVFIFATVLVCAQEPGVDVLGRDTSANRGMQVFAATCTAYCHGPNGEAGPGAPQLARRGLDAQYIERVITFGIPNTPMLGWGQKLPQEDIRALIAYVESLNGISSVSPTALQSALSSEALRGRDLFFDVAGDLKHCSNCHHVNGRGVGVAPPIKDVPAEVSALRNLITPEVVTATVNGETFPALHVTQVRDETRLYDLTTVPPVLRTFHDNAVKLSEGGSWRHTLALGTYSDEELNSILAFLRAAVPR